MTTRYLITPTTPRSGVGIVPLDAIDDFRLSAFDIGILAVMSTARDSGMGIGNLVKRFGDQSEVDILESVATLRSLGYIEVLDDGGGA